MTEAELSEIAADARNLREALEKAGFDYPLLNDLMIAAMPALVTRVTDGGPDVVFRAGEPRKLGRDSDAPLG